MASSLLVSSSGSNSNSTMMMVRNRLMKDASGEEGRYTGPVYENLPHGSGGDFRYTPTTTTTSSSTTSSSITSTSTTLVSAGRRYSGDWLFGKWHGHGQAWFPNGDEYKGEYSCDQRHGMGEYKWKDGRVYKGMFYKDIRHGQGLFVWPHDGTSYHGTFEQGQRQGQGTYKFQGGTYVGDFEQGEFHGYGECTWDDGRVYKGEWVKGQCHGMGIETDSLGRIVHHGRWEHNEALTDTKKKENKSNMTNTQSKSSSSSTLDNNNKNNNNIIPTDSTASTIPSLFFDALGRISNDLASLSLPATRNSNHDANHEEELEPVVNQILTDARGYTGTFRGMVLRGVPHGVGHMVYGPAMEKKTGIHTYQGFWDYGDWKEGQVEYRNGDVYHGDFVHNLRIGSGKYIWADGRQYNGEWKNDIREGRGQFHFPNGDLYDGQFVGGQRHGQGRFEYHDGSVFEGGFKKGQFHGHGCKFVLKDGRVYLGDFVEGVRSGHGKELYPNGSLRYEGEWNNDVPLIPNNIQPAPAGFVLLDYDSDDDNRVQMDGKKRLSSSIPSIVQETKDCVTVVEQVIKDALGNSGTFTGLVLKDLPHGVGRMVYATEIREGFWSHGYLEGHARAFFPNGDFYEGMFRSSQREGKGVYKWNDGRIYEGDYLDDQRHGHGRFVYPSGDEYVGGYIKGMRSGHGKFTFADGSSYNGEWIDSLYHGQGEHRETNGNYYIGEWKAGKKHGKGENYTAGNRLLQKGEWEEDKLVMEESKPEMADTEEQKPDLMIQESNVSRPQPFHWGSMTGENGRWKPLEKEQRAFDGYEDSGDEQEQNDLSDVKGANVIGGTAEDKNYLVVEDQKADLNQEPTDDSNDTFVVEHNDAL